MKFLVTYPVAILILC